MEEKYLNLISNYKKMDTISKQEEIIKNIDELLRLVYFVNKKTDNYNQALGILKKYDDLDSYYDALFTYIISLKEETAKLIEKTN